MITTWGHDPGIVPVSNVLLALNDALSHSAVLVQVSLEPISMETDRLWPSDASLLFKRKTQSELSCRQSTGSFFGERFQKNSYFRPSLLSISKITFRVERSNGRKYVCLRALYPITKVTFSLARFFLAPFTLKRLPRKLSWLSPLSVISLSSWHTVKTRD